MAQTLYTHVKTILRLTQKIQIYKNISLKKQFYKKSTLASVSLSLYCMSQSLRLLCAYHTYDIFHNRDTCATYVSYRGFGLELTLSVKIYAVTSYFA